jgi:hypothetical protein
MRAGLAFGMKQLKPVSQSPLIAIIAAKPHRELENES